LALVALSLLEVLGLVAYIELYLPLSGQAEACVECLDDQVVQLILCLRLPVLNRSELELSNLLRAVDNIVGVGRLRHDFLVLCSISSSHFIYRIVGVSLHMQVQTISDLLNVHVLAIESGNGREVAS